MLKTKNIKKDSLLWNFISSMLFGFQSVFLLMILTRTVGLEEAGIFAVAYADASLFLLAGKYGVRNYQVSDIHMEHTFGDYKTARLISTMVMVFLSAVNMLSRTLANGYSVKKSLVLFFVCLYKVPDSIEDVYYGEYQRSGRLDIAAKAMSVRLCCSIAAFAVFVTATRSLLHALVISIIFSFAVLWLLLKCTAPIFHFTKGVEKRSVQKIFGECFPLFAGSFLLQYISNASKYAIDACLDDRLQACYGFLAMPVFVVSLLSNVIFGPVIQKMAEYWDTGNRKLFLRRIAVQAAIIEGIMFICIAGAYWFGIPVLSFLYHTNLGRYKRELMVLLAGGGFLALSGLFNAAMTIMRSQYVLLGGYAVVSLIAWLFSKRMVMLYGITGAAWLYTGLMGMLFFIFLLLFVVVYHRRRRAL